MDEQRKSSLQSIPVDISWEELIQLELFNRQRLASLASSPDKRTPIRFLQDRLLRITQLQALKERVYEEAKVNGELDNE